MASGFFSITNDSVKWTNNGHGSAVFALDHPSVPAEFWNNVSTNGGNIRVYFWDGTTETAVAREIVDVDTSAQSGFIYFDSSNSSANTANEWRVYVEDGATEPAATDPLGRNAVWSDKELVMHLENPTLDSTGNNSPTDSGSLAAIGQVGDAREFNGVDNHVAVDTLNNFGQDLTQNFSMSFWIKTTATGFYSISGSLNDGFTTQISVTTGEGSLSGDIRLFIRDEGNNWIRINTVGNLINTGSFVRVTLVKTGNTAQDLKAYVNGSQATLDEATNSGTFSSTANLQYPLTIGARNLRGTFDQHIPATLDEFYLTKNALSASYVETEYNNQSDLSSFWTVGSWSLPEPKSFWTDFSEYTTGQQPSDWTKRWDPGAATATVESVSGTTGGKVFRLTGSSAGSNRHFWSWDKVPTGKRFEIIGRARVDNFAEGTMFFPGARISGDWDTRTGYIVRPRGGGDDWDTIEFLNGSTTLSTQLNSPTWENNTWYYISIRCDGADQANVDMKIWKEGETEPSWTVSFSPGSYTIAEGFAGLGGHADYTVEWDWVGISTDGTPAPRESVLTVAQGGSESTVSTSPEGSGKKVTESSYFSIKNDPTKWADTGHDNAVFSLDHPSVPNSFWDNVYSDGRNIRVYYFDGTSEVAVAREVSNIDVIAKTGEVYFDSSNSSANTENEWRIYTEEGASEPTPSGPLGSQSVWTDFNLIAHSGGGDDSSPQQNHFVEYNGASTGSAAGVIGNASDYVGASEHYQKTNNILGIGGASARIVSGWVKADSATQDNHNVWRTGAAGTNGRDFALVHGPSDPRFNGWNATYDLEYSLPAGVAYNDYVLHHHVYDGSTIYVYANGSLISQKTVTINTWDVDVFLGGIVRDESGNDIGVAWDNAFDGILNQFRVRSGVPLNTSGYISTEYENQQNHDAFWTVSLAAPPNPFTIKVKTDHPGTSSNTQITLPLTGTYNIDWGDGTQETLTGEQTHTYSTAGTYTIEIWGGLERINFNNSGDKDKLISIEQWGGVGWTSFERAFFGCSNLSDVKISSIDLSSVTSLERMFRDCSSLVSIDLSGWDTSSITTMSFMFYGCSSLTSLDVNGFNTSSVINMRWMFWNCSSLTSLDLSGWDTSLVENISYMFRDCSSLTSLNISSFNTSSVLYMRGVFYDCTSLTSLDVTSFNTSSVIDMKLIFWNCASLTSIDVTGFNTSSVTNMRGVFWNCTSLGSVDLSGWNTSLVEDMSDMFSWCSSLNSLNVSGFDTSQVTTMEDMFLFCAASDIDPSSWTISNVTNLLGFLEGAELSRAVYDSLLVNWEAQAVNAGISAHFGSSQYSAGAPETARSSLINSDTWVITDGGLFAQLSGGSEAIVSVAPEGAGFALEFAQGSSEAVVMVYTQTLGQKEARGPPSEPSIGISSEGSGQKGGLSGGNGLWEGGDNWDDGGNWIDAPEASALIVVEDEGTGIKYAEGWSETSVLTTTEGLGTLILGSGSESLFTIAPEGSGTKFTQNASESTVNVSPEGTPKKKAFGSSESFLQTTTESSGQKEGKGSSQGSISTSSEGAGRKESLSGGTTSLAIGSEGAGFKKAINGSQTSSFISEEGEGSKEGLGGSAGAIVTSTEGEGTMKAGGGSEGSINTLPSGEGSKSGFSDLEGEWSGNDVWDDSDTWTDGPKGVSFVLTPPEGSGSKKALGSEESYTEILPEGLGTVLLGSGSTISLSINPQGGGSKTTEGSATASIAVNPQQVGMKKSEGSSESSITLSEESEGLKKALKGSTSHIGISSPSEGKKSSSEGSQTAIEIFTLEGGLKKSEGSNVSSILITPEAVGSKATEEGSSTGVSVFSEGGYKRNSLGGSTPSIEISVTSEGLKSSEGGAGDDVYTSTESEGFKGGEGSSLSEISISGEASGSKDTEGSSTALISIEPQGHYQRKSFGGSTANIDVNAPSEGQKSSSEGFTSFTEISGDSSGFKGSAEGSSEAINIYAESSGKKSSSGSSVAFIYTEDLGGGIKKSRGSSGTDVGIFSEGSGEKKGLGSSLSSTLTDPSGEGFKGGLSEDVGLWDSNGVWDDSQNWEDSPLVILTDPEGEGTKTAEGAGEKLVTITTESSGTTQIASGTYSNISVEPEGGFFKKTSGSSTASVEVAPQTGTLKSIKDSSESNLVITSEGEGVFASSDGSESIGAVIEAEGDGSFVKLSGEEALITINGEGEGTKTTEGSSEALLPIVPSGEGTKFIDESSEFLIGIYSEGEGLKVSEEGSETSISLEVQSEGMKSSEEGSSPAPISVEPEGSGNSSKKGSAEAYTLTDPVGAGVKKGEGSSEDSNTISPQGAGSPTHKGGAQTSVEVIPEGSYTSSKSGGSQSPPTRIIPVSSGLASRKGGSEAQTGVSVWGEGIKGSSEGSENINEIIPEGEGAPIHKGGSSSAVFTSKEGSGASLKKGGSESDPIVLSSEGAGNSHKFGGSQSSVETFSEGDGTSRTRGGSESYILTDPSGDGTKFAKGSSESLVGVEEEESSGSKSTTSASSQGTWDSDTTWEDTLDWEDRPVGTALVFISPHGEGTQKSFGGSTSEIPVEAQGLGVVGRIEGSTANTRIEPLGEGIKLSEEGTTASIIIETQTGVIPSKFGGSASTLEIPSKGDGTKKTSNSAETFIDSIPEGSGIKEALSTTSEALTTADGEGEGTKYTEGSSTPQLLIEPQVGGFKASFLGSEGTLVVEVESIGLKKAFNSSETSVDLTSEGEGNTQRFGGSSPEIQIIPEGDGIAIRHITVLDLEGKITLRGKGVRGARVALVESEFEDFRDPKILNKTRSLSDGSYIMQWVKNERRYYFISIFYQDQEGKIYKKKSLQFNVDLKQDEEREGTPLVSEDWINENRREDPPEEDPVETTPIVSESWLDRERLLAQGVVTLDGSPLEGATVYIVHSKDKEFSSFETSSEDITDEKGYYNIRADLSESLYYFVKVSYETPSGDTIEETSEIIETDFQVSL